MRTIAMSLSTTSITSALKELRRIERDVSKKMDTMCKRLAEIGATRVSMEYARAWYVGPKDISVSVEEADGGYKIVASGQAVAFVEFGAGAKYGGAYPVVDGLDPALTAAGSWSSDPSVGKGHWDDPNGWRLPRGSVPLSGESRSWGNPPAMGMYYAGQDIRQNVERIAREVFAK